MKRSTGFIFLFLSVISPFVSAQKVASYYFENGLLEYSTKYPALEVIGTPGTYVREVVPKLGKAPRQVYRFEQNAGLKFPYMKIKDFPRESYTTEMYFRYDNADMLLNKELIAMRKLDDPYVHLVMTRDGKTKRVKMYLDGETVVDFTDTNDDLLLADNAELVFFTARNRQTTSGAVAMIKIYDFFIDEVQKKDFFAPFISLPETKELKTELTTPKIGKIKLTQLYFIQSLPQLLPESQPQLDKLVAFMKENPTTRIRLTGYTDNQGDFNMNIQLSKDRVEAVKKILVDNGVEPQRIETKGFGSMHPVASNKDENSRRLNRRVELEILE